MPSNSKHLSPQEVAIEVVPRVVQGFWELPPRPILERPSKMLSEVSVGVTKATMDRLSNALMSVENQATFSRCIRNAVIQSILTEVRQVYPEDILMDSIKNFAPELLSKIVDVSVGHICEMFQLHSAKVPAQLSPATSLVHDISADVTEQQHTPGPDTNWHVVSSATPTPPAELDSVTEIQADDNELQRSCVDEDLKSAREEESADVSPTSPTSPAENASFPEIQAHKKELQKFCEDENLKSSREDSGTVSPAPPLYTPLNERHSLKEDSEAVVASPAPPRPRLERVVIVTEEQVGSKWRSCLCQLL